MIPVPSPASLFAQEAIHPFYVFQYFSVVIWCMDGYFRSVVSRGASPSHPPCLLCPQPLPPILPACSYSIIIFLITMVSILVNVRLTYLNRRRLASLAHFDASVEVLRPEGRVLASSLDLVPGDLVVVGTGTLPCDLVLLQAR